MTATRTRYRFNILNSWLAVDRNGRLYRETSFGPLSDKDNVRTPLGPIGDVMTEYAVEPREWREFEGLRGQWEGGRGR